eukprot:NODE_33_length_36935_cov_1.609241.p11 type:complete len:370 gc:universal NODE_33_length_36935_cov_1.609241:6494-7603(+)
MLDILILKQSNELELLKKSEKSRNSKLSIDEIVKLDDEYRATKYEMDNTNRKFNEICKEMGNLYKKKDKSNEETKKIEVLKSEKLLIENNKKQLIQSQQTKLDNLLKVWKSVGNLVHPSVKVSNDESDNEIIRKWDPHLEQVPDSNILKPKTPLSHHQILDLIGGYSPDQGVKVAGHRGYFLTGVGCKLWRALSNYGIDFLEEREYSQVYTPFYMKKEVMARTAQLSQFDEELYKMVGEEEAYLIATSEQPLSAYHMNEWIEPSKLPIKYAGYSTCFRKEAGSHGKDTWGIFRIHQFEKIEQFVLTSPEKSWEMHESMLSAAEDFYQSVNLFYLVECFLQSCLYCFWCFKQCCCKKIRPGGLVSLSERI